MPLIKTIKIGADTKIGLWHIREPENFFHNGIIISREIHHPHKRLQHLAARYLLHELFEDFPVQDIIIAPNRRPYLADNSFYFSISHSGNYAAAIVSKSKKAGIDIEYMNPMIASVAHKFLNEPEKENCLLFDNPLLFQTLCWTAKEAVYKWYGKGEIDFKKNILLQSFAIKEEGEMKCLFEKENIKQTLIIHYETTAEYCMAWCVK